MVLEEGSTSRLPADSSPLPTPPRPPLPPSPLTTPTSPLSVELSTPTSIPARFSPVPALDRSVPDRFSPLPPHTLPMIYELSERRFFSRMGLSMDRIVDLEQKLAAMGEKTWSEYSVLANSLWDQLRRARARESSENSPPRKKTREAVDTYLHILVEKSRHLDQLLHKIDELKLSIDALKTAYHQAKKAYAKEQARLVEETRLGRIERPTLDSLGIKVLVPGQMDPRTRRERREAYAKDFPPPNVLCSPIVLYSQKLCFDPVSFDPVARQTFLDMVNELSPPVKK